MSYSVYIHTNKVNGKRYVGVTIRKPEQRWNNGEGYKEQPHFYSAIKKYGWDNFEHFIVEVDSREKMFELEKQCIEFYQTTNPEKGYNKSLGGESGAYLGKDFDANEYHKEYYKLNKEKFREYSDLNRDHINARRREVYRLNNEQRKLKDKEYRNLHKDEIKKRKKAYYQRHKDVIKLKSINYYYSQKHRNDIPITPLW